jgi:hypothetical protein
LGKRILKFEQESDLSLIGLASPLKDYRLAHFLSGIFFSNPERLDDLEWKHPKQNLPLFFSRFEVPAGTPEQRIHFFSNRSSGGYFIPSLKEFDYLLIWSPGISFEETQKILIQLKNTHDIVEARAIKREWIKEIDRLNWFLC